MAVVQQQQGIGSLAYPFYVIERSGDTKPAPTVADATLYVLETRETFAWKNGAWLLLSAPVAFVDPAVLADIAVSNRLVLRELRLLRQGMIGASTATECGGAPEELDEPH